MLGTGFLVSKEIEKALLAFEPISYRMCWIRLRGKHRKLSILNIHAPSKNKDIEEKIKFYEQVQNILEKFPRYDVKLVVGDMNARVGKEEINVLKGNRWKGKT
nr:unnamed protein product [Callosobruchus chinensis]